VVSALVGLIRAFLTALGGAWPTQLPAPPPP
jgi:hypothetical protein